MLEELIQGRPGPRLAVETRSGEAGLEVDLHLEAPGAAILHWGLARTVPGTWQAPPPAVRPPGTQPYGAEAVQTPFPAAVAAGAGPRCLTLRFAGGAPAPYLVFDLLFPETKRWENNQGRDYAVRLGDPKPAGPGPLQVLERLLPGSDPMHPPMRTVLALDGGGELAFGVERTGGRCRVELVTDVPGPLLLHWGVVERPSSRWVLPAAAWQPAGTVPFDATSVRTPFAGEAGLSRLQLDWSEAGLPGGLSFVLFQPATGAWIKHRGQNLFVPLGGGGGGLGSGAGLPPLAERIAEAEMGDHGWTLMHRFNLCHELIEEAGEDPEAWTTLLVWLRYSAIRQLTWQRNYNTKPRELAHAQDRLTARLASAYLRQPANREWIRQLLACLGRGGDGQRIRDEILQIMHRHHIKEVAGRFMEEWHQKLHNNTTPDDVVICEAYLAFLHSDGDLGRYDEALRAGGVTRERLAGFDRPIRENPDFVPHLKHGLIHDFENYLRLLKSVHSATDLETAANTAGALLGGAARGALDRVRQGFHDARVPVTELTANLTVVRQALHSRLAGESDLGLAKELLYLDMALEEALRTGIERVIHSGLGVGALVELIGLVQDNLALLPDGAEISQCLREWRRLPREDTFTPDWALHAKAALDRLRRASEEKTDRSYRLLQPKAVALGRAFHSDSWVVNVFSEELVRGQPLFLVSMLIHHLEPILRQTANLGDWQVISPCRASGRVLVVPSFRSIQGQRFDQPTVVVTEEVKGDEEPPDGVRAVLTTSSVDLVSHVAVRARNIGLLFATCYARPAFERLKGMQGRLVTLQVTPAGDVTLVESVEEPSAGGTGRNVPPSPPRSQAQSTPASASPPGAGAQGAGGPQARPGAARSAAPGSMASWRALSLPEFSAQQVGGKSWHLRELSSRLPDWVHLPRSVALPFGTFDLVMADPVNRTVAGRYQELVAGLGPDPEPRLAEIRACLLDVQLPEKLRQELRRAMDSVGLPWPDDWATASTRIKQVWASKWNSRAYFSRQSRNWPHAAVDMAVLIQEVIEAEYAFVLHTVNPFNQHWDEVYAEVVLGLGETLVGNHPGRAFSAVAMKPGGRDRSSVLAYPSKSLGLFGGGWIFRSDSNAEDLEGYAGAGLYDSLLLQPAREVTLDYTGDTLVWDPGFRGEFIENLRKLGRVIEEALGAPQDIEGVFARGRFHVVQSRPQVGLGPKPGLAGPGRS